MTLNREWVIILKESFLHEPSCVPERHVIGRLWYQRNERGNRGDGTVRKGGRPDLRTAEGSSVPKGTVLVHPRRAPTTVGVGRGDDNPWLVPPRGPTRSGPVTTRKPLGPVDGWTSTVEPKTVLGKRTAPRLSVLGSLDESWTQHPLVLIKKRYEGVIRNSVKTNSLSD